MRLTLFRKSTKTTNEKKTQRAASFPPLREKHYILSLIVLFNRARYDIDPLCCCWFVSVVCVFFSASAERLNSIKIFSNDAIRKLHQN